MKESYIEDLGSRQGCDPAGESPAMLIVRVEHVATPHPGPGNRPGDAWCERPGRLVVRGPRRWEQPGGLASASTAVSRRGGRLVLTNTVRAEARTGLGKIRPSGI